MNLKKWQSKIPDSTELLQLNMAGTHDCAARYVQLSYFSKCQSKSIYEQLCIGVRGLDVRVEAKNDKLVMVHGIAKAFNTPNHFSKQMELGDLLSQCYRFLDENPSEAIVLQFKNDSGRENEKCFDNLYNTYISAHKDKWFLENKSPLLSEARGKIVLIRRCKMAHRDCYNEKNSGIDFSKWVEQNTAVPDALSLEAGSSNEMTFIILDRYKYKPVPRWNECVKPFLDKMTEFSGKYIVNYLSTAGGLKGPYRNAKYINSHFMAYPLECGKYYGMIYVDFPNESLVLKIIKSNRISCEGR